MFLSSAPLSFQLTYKQAWFIVSSLHCERAIEQLQKVNMISGSIGHPSFTQTRQEARIEPEPLDLWNCTTMLLQTLLYSLFFLASSSSLCKFPILVLLVLMYITCHYPPAWSPRPQKWRSALLWTTTICHGIYLEYSCMFEAGIDGCQRPQEITELWM